MNSLFQLISSFGFHKQGNLVLDPNLKIFFSLNSNNPDYGWVYLWIEILNDEATIVYVGKAGRTLHKRCREHVGGFKNGNPTGSAHSKRILDGIGSGKRYEIWSRKSEVTTLFGEENISMVEIEERAFIKKFQPIWNKL